MRQLCIPVRKRYGLVLDMETLFHLKYLSYNVRLLASFNSKCFMPGTLISSPIARVSFLFELAIFHLSTERCAVPRKLGLLHQATAELPTAIRCTFM